MHSFFCLSNCGEVASIYVSLLLLSIEYIKYIIAQIVALRTFCSFLLLLFTFFFVRLCIFGSQNKFLD